MSGVNVLAVLHWASVSADSAKDSREADEAFAAVFELLTATKAMLESGDEGAECGSRADLRWSLTKARVAEALARCEGGAA